MIEQDENVEIWYREYRAMEKERDELLAENQRLEALLQHIGLLAKKVYP